MMKTPFLFVIDFAMRKPLIIPLDEIDATEMLFDVNGQTNAKGRPETDKTLEFAICHTPNYGETHFSFVNGQYTGCRNTAKG